jgi:hypothetical protein
MILVSYVFNSPMLIPWSVVEDIPDQDLSEIILLWGEARHYGYCFPVNEFAARITNSRQKIVFYTLLTGFLRLFENLTV